MATIIAFVPDLLFGSNVAGAVAAAGHECRLLAAPADDELAAADALIVDLTADVETRLATVAPAVQRGLPTLAFYSHVEADVRSAAQAAGIGLVVPRSRMAREGPSLVSRLLEGH
jgi:hypothetical protein